MPCCHSIAGSSFASDDSTRQTQQNDAHSESMDYDEDSDDGKPNIMMGDDLVDLMSAAGLGSNPAAIVAPEEDDPLSSMNRVVQKFSDDEEEDQEEDDRSESF